MGDFLMPTVYIDPQGRESTRMPRHVKLADGRSVSVGSDCADAEWERIPDCSIRVEPAPEPMTEEDILAASITPAIRASTEQLLELWASTGLPVPADKEAAAAALEAHRRAAPDTTEEISRLALATRLLAIYADLVAAGGTWAQVLHLSATGNR
jgi:hypothetical protein